MTYIRKVELTKKQFEILSAVISEGSVFIPGDSGPRVSDRQCIAYREKQASLVNALSTEGAVMIEIRR